MSSLVLYTRVRTYRSHMYCSKYSERSGDFDEFRLVVFLYLICLLCPLSIFVHVHSESRNGQTWPNSTASIAWRNQKILASKFTRTRAFLIRAVLILDFQRQSVIGVRLTRPTLVMRHFPCVLGVPHGHMLAQKFGLITFGKSERKFFRCHFSSHICFGLFVEMPKQSFTCCDYQWLLSCRSL